MKNKIKSIEISTDPKDWLLIVVCFLVLFVLPIQLGLVLDNPEKFSNITNGNVLGVTTDNTGRFVDIPILGFQFDTQLRDPSTISFLFGVIMLTLAIILIIVFFSDFRKKEKKYISY